MADHNSVKLIGRLTRDVQLKNLPSTTIAEFGVAVGRKWKTATGESKEESTFVDCTMFGKGAQVFAQYVKKGSQVFLDGRLKLDSWEDKTSGQKRSKLTVVVEDFQFLDSKGGTARDTGGDGYDPPSRDEVPSRQLEEDIPW